MHQRVGLVRSTYMLSTQPCLPIDLSYTAAHYQYRIPNFQVQANLLQNEHTPSWTPDARVIPVWSSYLPIIVQCAFSQSSSYPSCVNHSKVFLVAVCPRPKYGIVQCTFVFATWTRKNQHGASPARSSSTAKYSCKGWNDRSRNLHGMLCANRLFLTPDC